MGIEIHDAILAINPDAVVGVVENDYEKIEWLSGTTPISVDDIKAKQAELKKLHDSQEYARKRKAEYDQLNQFELIGEDSINGTNKHKNAIIAIKNKYPK